MKSIAIYNVLGDCGDPFLSGDVICSADDTVMDIFECFDGETSRESLDNIDWCLDFS